MMTKARQFLLLFLCVSFSITTFSQSKKNNQTSCHVTYSSDIDSPLTSDELAKIQEVYGDKMQEDVLNHPQRVKDIKHILRNRIEIVDIGDKDISSFAKLSDVPLFNIYVKTLQRDAIFNPDDFNPLKYSFNFYSNKSEIYRVDNTTYYIRIKSQFQ